MLLYSYRAALDAVIDGAGSFTNFDADRLGITQTALKWLWERGLIAYRQTGDRSCIWSVTEAGRQLATEER